MEKKIGLVCSTFDLLHAGHVIMLEEAKKHCDFLTCALQTHVVDRPEKNRPVQTVYERWKQLSAVKYVDEVIPYESEEDLLNLILSMPKHVRILGSEYERRKWTGSELYFPDSVVYLKRDHFYSTSELRKRVRAAEEVK